MVASRVGYFGAGRGVWGGAHVVGHLGAARRVLGARVVVCFDRVAHVCVISRMGEFGAGRRVFGARAMGYGKGDLRLF